MITVSQVLSSSSMPGLVLSFTWVISLNTYEWVGYFSYPSVKYEDSKLREILELAHQHNAIRKES